MNSLFIWRQRYQNETFVRTTVILNQPLLWMELALQQKMCPVFHKEETRLSGTGTVFVGLFHALPALPRFWSMSLACWVGTPLWVILTATHTPLKTMVFKLFMTSYSKLLCAVYSAFFVCTVFSCYMPSHVVYGNELSMEADFAYTSSFTSFFTLPGPRNSVRWSAYYGSEIIPFTLDIIPKTVQVRLNKLWCTTIMKKRRIPSTSEGTFKAFLIFCKMCLIGFSAIYIYKNSLTYWWNYWYLLKTYRTRKRTPQTMRVSHFAKRARFSDNRLHYQQ